MEVVGFLIGPVVFFGIVGGIIWAFARGWSDIRFSSVVSGYVAIMTAVSLFVIAGGAASLLKAGFSEIGGRDFSYYVSRDLGAKPVPAEGPSGRSVEQAQPAEPAQPVEPEEPIDYSDRELRDDVADGITFTAVGLFILAVHQGLGRAIRRRVVPAHQRTINRALGLGMTLIGGAGFLISGGVGLSQLLRRTILEADLQPFESPPQPGGSLAWAIVFLVLWLGFGYRVWRDLRGEADRAS